MKKTPGCVQSSEETKGVLSGEPNFHFSVLMTWPVSVEYVKKGKLESLLWNIEAGRTCKYETRWHCSRRVCLTPINRPRPLKGGRLKTNSKKVKRRVQRNLNLLGKEGRRILRVVQGSVSQGGQVVLD